MSDNTLADSGRTKQEILAAAFLKEFRADFDKAIADGKASFDIKKEQLDNFFVAYGYITFSGQKNTPPKMPEPGGVGWSHLVTERNKLRRALNTGASVGEHGEPPYRIDKKYEPLPPFEKGPNAGKPRRRELKTLWSVQLLTGMVRVTHREAALKLKSLSIYQQKGLDKMAKYIMEHADKMSLVDRARFESAQVMFPTLTNHVALMMGSYAEIIEQQYRNLLPAPSAPERPASGENQP